MATENRCGIIWNKTHDGEEQMRYWPWEPTQCSLEVVDAAKLCRATSMRGRKEVLIVGEK